MQPPECGGIVDTPSYRFTERAGIACRTVGGPSGTISAMLEITACAKTLLYST